MTTRTQHPPQIHRLLDAEELATQLGESKQTVYALAREKGLPCIRFGRAIRFDPFAVREWLQSGGTASSEAA